MRHRTSSDRPLGNQHAFFEINDSNMTVTSYNIPHSDVQSFSRWLDGDACGITTWHLDAAHQFGRPYVNYLDRSTTRHVIVSATIGDFLRSPESFQGTVFEGFDGGIVQMGGRIVSPVISSPVRITISRHSDDLGYLVCCPADGYKSVICHVHPDFVGLGKIDGLFWTCSEPRLVDHLACPQVHNDKSLVVLPTNK